MVHCVTGDTLTAIANAIRGRTGTSSSMTLQEMASAINGMAQSGGDMTVIDGIVTGTIDTVVCSASASVPNYMFSGCTSLRMVDMQNCTDVGISAFAGCDALSTVTIPTCCRIYGYAFDGCTSLVSIDLTSVSSVTTLATSSAFRSTPMVNSTYLSGTYGSIYVPISLYGGFVYAPGWKTISERIVPV